MNECILRVPVFIIFGRPELFHHQAELVSLWLEGLGHTDKEFEHTRQDKHGQDMVIRFSNICQGFSNGLCLSKNQDFT